MMSLNWLRENIRNCWSLDTCADSYRDRWCSSNPSVGQCLVTALIVQDYFGGDIYKCKIKNYTHYFNNLNGVIFDLTIEQFQMPQSVYKNIEVINREKILKNENTKNRYDKLKSRLINSSTYKNS